MSHGSHPVRARLMLGSLFSVLLFFAFSLPILNAARAAETTASIARGGRLCDAWFVEVRKTPPGTKHSAYPKIGKQSGPATWRCKECHGWDYKGAEGAYNSGAHYTGIKGIQALAGAEPYQVLAILGDENHGFNRMEELSQSDLRDLANFVTKGQIEMDRHIDAIAGTAKGTAGRNRHYYQNVCANCHGRDGLKMRSVPPLGWLARHNPWEALHKMLNGHPDGEMPPLRVLGEVQILVDILAYMQTLPGDELIWSISRGGRLYDNWYRELGLANPTRSHPAYPADAKYAKAPKANWRCKECHGWDYKGRLGAYGEGPHRTGIEGIRGMAGADTADILVVLRNETHRYRGDLDYRPTMADRDLQDLAHFVSRGQVDMDAFIAGRKNMARGDPRRQEDFYATVCANCHGPDGRKLSDRRPLGVLARVNPWQVLHNILNGHPGVEMPPLRVLDQMPTVVDILAFLQTLPGR